MFSYCPAYRNKQQSTNNNQPNTFGFTLIELIITIMIAAILFGIGIAYFNANNKNQTLINTANEVKITLRSLQSFANNSVARTLKGRSCPANWSYVEHNIIFQIDLADKDFHHIFIKCVDSANPSVTTTVSDSLKKFPQGIRLSQSCWVIFNPITHQVGFGPSDPGFTPCPTTFPIDISLTSGSQSRTICISQAGNIYDGNPGC